LSAYNFSFWIDERHVFGICSLDGRPAAFGIPLGKDLVQVAVKQLLRVWHAVNPLVVIRPRSGTANSTARASDTSLPPWPSSGADLSSYVSLYTNWLLALPDALPT
jgi:hypothetical protein